MVVQPLQTLFQSTLPRGERQHPVELPEEIMEVSIHAPTRGATESQCPAVILGEFQSTLPRGERRRLVEILPSLTGFNPRSHAGSDSYLPDKDTLYLQFQSTLPRGERRSAPE